MAPLPPLLTVVVVVVAAAAEVPYEAAGFMDIAVPVRDPQICKHPTETERERSTMAERQREREREREGKRKVGYGYGECSWRFCGGGVEISRSRLAPEKALNSTSLRSQCQHDPPHQCPLSLSHSK